MPNMQRPSDRRIAGVANALRPPTQAAAVDTSIRAGCCIGRSIITIEPGPLFLDTYADLLVPHGSTELAALCRDVDVFGYCLIRDALAPAETAALAKRTAEQALSPGGFVIICAPPAP